MNASPSLFRIVCQILSVRSRPGTARSPGADGSAGCAEAILPLHSAVLTGRLPGRATANILRPRSDEVEPRELPGANAVQEMSGRMVVNLVTPWSDERIAGVARIVRPMKKDPNDQTRPLVGPRFCCLGVRLHEVTLDPAGDPTGNVLADGRGMSVSADWRNLAPVLIPEELEDDTNGARGKGMAVFVHGQGTGPFAEGPVAAGLEMLFKPGKTDSGNVCPVADVLLSQFQADLAATAPDWVIDPS